MKLPHIYFIMNTIADLSDSAILDQSINTAALRRNVRILIIDDNEFFAEEYLKRNGFQITHKNDIDTIADVEPYGIIMCDIAGVGKKLGYSKEGAFIIREIHANFPSKQIIAYTSYTYDAAYNQFFSLADYVAKKDLSIDDWISVLDEQIRQSTNPAYQWGKIRNYLFDKGISTIMIAKIEDKYVKAINSKNFTPLKALIQDKESNLGTVITDFTTSLCAKLILGAIGGN